MSITFECLKEIEGEDDIDWKLIYVGSAKKPEHD